MTNDKMLLNYLEMAFNQAKELVYIIDTDFKFRVCNWAFADFFGLDSPEKVIGLTSLELMPTHISEKNTITDELAMKGKSSTRNIINFTKSGEETKTFSCLKVPLYELDIVIGLLCIMRDISHEEKLLENYRKQEAVNSAIIANAPVGISVRDSVGNLLSFNKTWQKIWNHSDQSLKEDMQHKRTELKLDNSDSYLSDYNDELISIYQKGGELFVPEIETHITRDGLTVWVSQHFYAILNLDNSVQRVVVITVDATNQVYGRKTLEITQKNYKKLSETIPVGVFRTEIRGNGLILSMNPAFKRMFNLPKDNKKSMRIVDFIENSEDEKEIWSLLQKQKQIDNREILLKKANGETFWGSVTIRILTQTSTAIAEGVITDITSRMTAFKNLQKTINGTVLAMSQLVDLKDPYTSGHQKRVADLACAIGKELGLKPDMMEGLRISGILHDIGKMAVPTEILTKPGAITRSEMLLLREHPEDGYAILKSIDFPWPIAEIVLQHHERIDGSGYPLGLMGPDIRLEAKILAVADVVEAMATMRPYRASLGLHEALQTISAGAGIYFDRQIVNACINLFMEKNYKLSDENSIPSFINRN